MLGRLLVGGRPSRGAAGSEHGEGGGRAKGLRRRAESSCTSGTRTPKAIRIASTGYHGGNTMNFDPEFDEPLTDEELDFLERFLSSNAVCDDAMDAVMLHGFLTAVISGPN